MDAQARPRPWSAGFAGLDRGDIETGKLGTGWKQFYCYFDTISPDHFRAIEYADPVKRAEVATLTQAELDAG